MQYKHSDAARRRLVRRTRTYRAIAVIKTVMDDWHVDPLLGLVPGGVGDVVSQLLVLPYLYISVVLLRSVPLSLAVVYNALRDVLVGLVPFWVGDVLDFFNRSYRKNYQMIVGYVEGDREVADSVRRKAAITAVMIVVMLVAIVALVALTLWLVRRLPDLLLH